MKFTVVWKPSAETKLAEIWTDATDRQTVSDAANSIDLLLRSFPIQVGESRKHDTRILSVSPLSVYFDAIALSWYGPYGSAHPKPNRAGFVDGDVFCCSRRRCRR